MARRRLYRPQENVRRGPRINGLIRISPIRLIDENDEMIGVIDTAEALRRAQDVGLDLVEVAPDSDPPVCRILDYGKFRYEQSKKDKAQRAKSKTLDMKEVRLGRSMKIDPHDIQIRLNKARQFLMEGHKVQIVQNFRGREMMHKSRGDDRMKDIIEKLSEVGKLEVPPRMAGRRMTMIMAPDKAKIDQVKRKMTSAGASTESAMPTHPDDAAADDMQNEDSVGIQNAESSGGEHDGQLAGGLEPRTRVDGRDSSDRVHGEGAGQIAEGDESAATPEPAEASQDR